MVEKVICKYCFHEQKIKNREVKCGVCLKKGFLIEEEQKNDDTQVQDNIKQHTESLNNRDNVV